MLHTQYWPQWMAAACTNLAIVCSAFALCLWTGGGYAGYAATIVAGRACRILWADRAIRRLQEERRVQKMEPIA